MNDIRNVSEISETSKPKPEGFKNIKPESGMTVEKARDFINSRFERTDNHYTTYEDRLKHTPVENSERGKWEGDRGESKFIPSEQTPEGVAAKEKLAEKGLDGIEYKDAEPDFSKCTEATVQIDNMTANRYDYRDNDGLMKPGNFSQADMKLAEDWNASGKDGKTDWTDKDIAEWRSNNRCSWHERCDTKTMDLVSQDIHDYFRHSGGVAECKARDNIGGKFDE